jgi:hypothetical protein
MIFVLETFPDESEVSRLLQTIRANPSLHRRLASPPLTLGVSFLALESQVFALNFTGKDRRASSATPTSVANADDNANARPSAGNAAAAATAAAAGVPSSTPPAVEGRASLQSAYFGSDLAKRNRLCESTGRRLAALCVHLHENPVIRVQENSEVGVKISVAFQAQMAAYLAGNENFWWHGMYDAAARCTLVIMDRSIDALAPLLHGATWQDFAQTVLHGDRVVDTDDPAATNVNTAARRVHLSEANKMWVNCRHLQVDQAFHAFNYHCASLQENHLRKDVYSLRCNQLNVYDVVDRLHDVEKYVCEESEVAAQVHLYARLFQCPREFAGLKETMLDFEQSVVTGEKWPSNETFTAADAERILQDIDTKFTGAAVAATARSGGGDAGEAVGVSLYGGQSWGWQNVVHLVSIMCLSYGLGSTHVQNVLRRLLATRSPAAAKTVGQLVSLLAGLKVLVKNESVRMVDLASLPSRSPAECQSVWDSLQRHSGMVSHILDLHLQCRLSDQHFDAMHAALLPRDSESSAQVSYPITGGEGGDADKCGESPAAWCNDGASVYSCAGGQEDVWKDSQAGPQEHPGIRRSSGWAVETSISFPYMRGPQFCTKRKILEGQGTKEDWNGSTYGDQGWGPGEALLPGHTHSTGILRSIEIFNNPDATPSRPASGGGSSSAYPDLDQETYDDLVSSLQHLGIIEARKKPMSLSTLEITETDADLFVEAEPLFNSQPTLSCQSSDTKTKSTSLQHGSRVDPSTTLQNSHWVQRPGSSTRIGVVDGDDKGLTSADSQTLRQSSPKPGHLWVVVKGCSELIPARNGKRREGIFRKPNCNCYVRTRCLLGETNPISRGLTTDTKKKTLNPKFNQLFDIELPAIEDIDGLMPKLRVEVWDQKSSPQADDLIGHIDIPLLSLLDRLPWTNSFKLRSPESYYARHRAHRGGGGGGRQRGRTSSFMCGIPGKNEMAQNKNPSSCAPSSLFCTGSPLRKKASNVPAKPASNGEEATANAHTAWGNVELYLHWGGPDRSKIVMQNFTGPRTIVFVAGGLTHAESREAYSASQNHGQQVFIGSDSMIGLDDFIADAVNLGSEPNEVRESIWKGLDIQHTI